jgi:hypothetical protein
MPPAVTVRWLLLEAHVAPMQAATGTYRGFQTGTSMRRQPLQLIAAAVTAAAIVDRSGHQISIDE